MAKINEWLEEDKKNLSELAKKRKHTKETKNKIALSGMKKIIQYNKNGDIYG